MLHSAAVIVDPHPYNDIIFYYFAGTSLASWNMFTKQNLMEQQIKTLLSHHTKRYYLLTLKGKLINIKESKSYRVGLSARAGVMMEGKEWAMHGCKVG